MGHLRISLVLLPRFGSWACITHFPFQKMAIEDALVARLKAPGPHFGTLSPAQHCDCDKVCILKAQVSVQFIWIHIYIHISSWGTRPMRIHQHPSTLFSMIFHQTPIFPSKHGSSTQSPEQLLTGALCDAFVHPQDLLLEHCQVWMQICTAKNMCTIRAASCTHTGAGST